MLFEKTVNIEESHLRISAKVYQVYVHNFYYKRNRQRNKTNKNLREKTQYADSTFDIANDKDFWFNADKLKKESPYLRRIYASLFMGRKR